jgi:hypothetical protein
MRVMAGLNGEDSVGFCGLRPAKHPIISKYPIPKTAAPGRKVRRRASLETLANAVDGKGARWLKTRHLVFARSRANKKCQYKTTDAKMACTVFVM